MKTMKLTLIALSILCTFSDIQAQSKPDALAEARRAIEESNAIYFESFAKDDPLIFIERVRRRCLYHGTE